MSTFTTVDTAIEAHYKTGITVEQAHEAVITYITQIEELDGRTIDQDKITLEDADFLIESVHSANASGDLN